MSVEYAWYAIEPRWAELGFRVELPAGWIVHDLPEEPPEFDNPIFLLPLAIITAPHSAIVFACAARPGHAEGTLHDWAWHLMRENAIEPLAFGEHRLGELQALVGETLQDSELGPMRVRFAFAEDGGRLLQLSLSAPAMLDGVVAELWFRLLAGFVLASLRGATVALFPPVLAAPAAEQGVDYEFAVYEEEPPRPAAPSSSGEQTDERAPDGPPWWQRALALERQDRLQEAEQLVRDSIPHLFFARQIAELYRLRMHRLAADGDGEGARAAYREADGWIGFYAGLATSGGEGAALSRERDGFRAALRAEFGG